MCSPFYSLPQVLAKNASDQALQKTVVAGYNSKLASRAKSFARSHWGVSTRRVASSGCIACRYAGLTWFFSR